MGQTLQEQAVNNAKLRGQAVTLAKLRVQAEKSVLATRSLNAR